MADQLPRVSCRIGDYRRRRVRWEAVSGRSRPGAPVLYRSGGVRSGAVTNSSAHTAHSRPVQLVTRTQQATGCTRAWSFMFRVLWKGEILCKSVDNARKHSYNFYKTSTLATDSSTPYFFTHFSCFQEHGSFA